VSPLLRDSFQLLWPRLWYDHPKYHPRRPTSCSNILRCRMTSSARYLASPARRVVPSACLGSILIEMEVSSWVVSEVQTAQRESCFVPGKLADRLGGISTSITQCSDQVVSIHQSGLHQVVDHHVFSRLTTPMQLSLPALDLLRPIPRNIQHFQYRCPMSRLETCWQHSCSRDHALEL
jgi:hypothetical protein